ncbi:hypothetical protein MHI27_05675 [Paenibacillus sp. FSL H8-0261]|nr:hypothetical protein [Paenibacillus odorifer]
MVKVYNWMNMDVLRIENLEGKAVEMTKFGSFILELLRMCVLLVLTLFILGGVERFIYQSIFGQPVYNWSMALGNLLIFFMLYRNHFQFKGWYKSQKNQKLTILTTRITTVISLGLIILPIVRLSL